MIPVKFIDPDDLALYAMQLLPPDEMEEMRLNLQHSAEGRRLLAEIYGDLSIFAHTADMHAPPASARQLLMKHVAREKKTAPVDPLAGPATQPATVLPFEEGVAKRSVAATVLPWVGWAIAAGMAALSVGLYQQRDRLKTTVAMDQAQMKQTQVSADLANTALETMKDPSAAHFTLTSAPTKLPPQGRISYLSGKGSLMMIATNLDTLAPNKMYELWLFPADGRDPIPAGVFHPDEHGYATLVLPELPKGVAAKKFAVTVEDGEVAVPTSAPVLVGTAG
jgi:hypothetical protein